MGACGVERREVVLPRGPALADVGFRLLQPFDCAGAACRERLIAVKLLLCEIEHGLIAVDGGLAFRDDRLLLLDLRFVFDAFASALFKSALAMSNAPVDLEIGRI